MQLRTGLHFIFSLTLILISSAVHATDHKDSCGERMVWTPFFKSTMTVNELTRQIGAKKILERRLEAGGQMFVTAMKVGDNVQTFFSKEHSSEALALKSRNLYRRVADLAEIGGLGPFRLNRFHARYHRSMLFNFVEGRSIQDLIDDPTLDRDRVQHVVERFKESLSVVKQFAAASEAHIYEPDEASDGFGLVVEMSRPTAFQFSIDTTNVWVETRTGQFVIVDL